MSTICKLVISNGEKCNKLYGNLIFQEDYMHRFGLNKNNKVSVTYSNGTIVVKPDPNGVKFTKSDFYAHWFKAYVDKPTVTKFGFTNPGVIEFHKATKKGDEIHLSV